MMISKKVGILGSITAAAVVCGVLAGCGGSSASVAGINVSVPVTGGVQNQGATVSADVSSSTTPQQVQITAADGTTQTVVVPPGESFHSGDQAVVLAPNQPLLGGLSTGPRTNGTVKPQQGANLPIYVDGVPSGVFLNAVGALTLGLLLGPGNHTLSIQGAVTITGTSSTGSPSVLNVNRSITLNCTVRGILASLPINLLGKLPGNGGSTANGNSITGDLLGFPIGYGQLTLTWPGVTKNQKVPLRITNGGLTGTFTFHDPLNNSDDTIPANGIDTITFGYSTHI